MIASPGDPLRQHEPFRVSDVRQHVYCPRITFFNYVAPVPRHRTIKMQEGSQAHLEFADLERRRTLARYKLDEGQREFRVPLRSERLELSGVLDMLITSPSGTYPVEFKNTHGKMALHHKYQLVAYGMMVEETRGKVVREGFVYIVPSRSPVKVLIDKTSRLHVRRVIGEMTNIISRGLIPKRTRRGGRCRDCEFRNYCADD